MKGKRFYFILATVLLVGLTSIYFFRKQREAQFLEFEAYEIATVEAQVNGLYNEGKTDIHEEISDVELEEIENLLQDVKTKEFSRKNSERLHAVEKDFIDAKEMNHIQMTIRDLFVETGVVDRAVSNEEVEGLEIDIDVYRDKTDYYNRNHKLLADAKTQIQAIKFAEGYLEGLFNDGLVREDVTREDEEEALARIETIKNQEVKDDLLAQAERLNIALTEAEEALALEEAVLTEIEEVEEEMEENASESTSAGSASTASTWTPPPRTPSTPSRPAPNPAPTNPEPPADGETGDGEANTPDQDEGSQEDYNGSEEPPEDPPVDAGEDGSEGPEEDGENEDE